MSAEHATPKPLLVIAGTRPELLKLSPVVKRLRSAGAPLSATLCFSGQHVELLDSVLAELALAPDVDLRAPFESRSLSKGLAWLLERLDDVVNGHRPSGVIVQGDTNTALAGALVAFHRELPCFHVEAGLRTTDIRRPFPEELNRRFVSRLAALHFAPTERARRNLLAEGIAESAIVVTGNTIIDALQELGQRSSPDADAILSKTAPGSRKVLVTLHRRENEGVAADIARAVLATVDRRLDVEVVWILHLNALRPHVTSVLSGHPRVHLVEPLSYTAFVSLMRASTLILTDSGGIQEEAPAFGVPVLVLRDETERPEAVEAGVARVVGGSAAALSVACAELLDDAGVHAAMSRRVSPFGDGQASVRIVEVLRKWFEVRGGA